MFGDVDVLTGRSSAARAAHRERSSLLHLLQRAEPVTPWLPAFVHGLSLTNKADNHGLTGLATLQQM
ncbi:hypothetical protein PshuTeo2_03960 [Pseudomonas hunanensis]|jgi:hypothetical protein|nr:hypothetical protein [Pseudomonas hunanensis]ORL68853.1 hypothetical protein B7H19_13935 [Pseudomonas putida]